MHAKPLGPIALALMLASFPVGSAQGGARGAPVPGIYPWSDQVRSDPFRRSDSNDRLFPWAGPDRRVCGYDRIRVHAGRTPRWRRVYHCQ